MQEATTFSRNLEMEVRFEIGRKLLRSSVDRDGFLFECRWKNSFRKRKIDTICDDWIGPNSLKQSFKRKFKLGWNPDYAIGTCLH